jgi:hypothetical protein
MIMLSHSDYRQGFWFAVSVLCILGIFALITPGLIDQVNAQEGEGTLTIHSDGEGQSSSSGLSGHSWIEYTPDGGGATTYGTWGTGTVENPGVNQDLEMGWESEASRTTHIGEVQEQALMDYIDSQRALGPDAHTLWHNCSSFASEAWEAATGEHISPGWVPSPTALRENIEVANGGQPRGSVGGGTHGGIESKPLNDPPSAFLNENLADGVSMIGPCFQFQQVVTLEDIIPAQGPNNTIPIVTVPVDALALTETTNATAVDFVDNETGIPKAVILGIQTAGRPHDHDYAVCNSYHGYSVENVAPIPFPDLLLGVTEESPPWFWYMLTQKDELLEEALTFVVFVDQAQKLFTIDSRWLVDYYPEQLDFDFDYIFNFQIWASSSEEAYKLLQRAIENLADFEGGSWNVSFANAVEPSPPTLLIRRAEYLDGGAQLTVQSWLTDTRTVTFYGSWRSYDDWDTSMGFNYLAEVAPGTSTVLLPFENMLDAVITSNVDGFLSKVYVGSGFWFVFDDGQSTVTMRPGECAPISDVGNGLILAGCPRVTGTITATYGYVGLVRTLNPNGKPVDVSDYQALTFMARGDGKSYQVKLETDAVKDYDYHQFVFTPPSNEWRQYIIPLWLFRQQGWGAPVVFTAEDVKSVAWVSVGPHCDDSIELGIDRVAFINSLIVGDTVGPTSTNDVFGPYIITTEIDDDVGVETATLHYSIDGDNFIEVVMSEDENAFIGQIPGQALGSEVRYCVTAGDADGNVATDPVDAPYTIYHFGVEWYPSLLADDFNDMNPANVLGGISGTFRDPDEGGIITPCYGSDALRLGFDVTDHLSEKDEYAGYYSELEQTDLTLYNSVALRVKGDVGREKVKIGLNDGVGHEPKIELCEYLPNGITTDWQMVKIPLDAFASITDRSAIKSFTLIAEERIGSGSGTVHVDDVRFEPDALSIVVDNFNDTTTFNGVGGYHTTFASDDATVSTSFDETAPYGGMGASLAVTYGDVHGASHAVWQTGLNGLNASAYDKLVLAVRGGFSGEQFHIYLEDLGTREYVNATDYASITTNWQVIEIPLSDFGEQGIDLAQLEYLQIAFEWEEMSGTIYLDDIRFVLPPPPTITAVSPIVAANDVPTTLTISGQNFWMTPTVALGYYLLEDVTLAISTTIQATIPPGIPPDVYDVFVIQPNMQSARWSNALTTFRKIYLPIVLRSWNLSQ